MSTIVGKGIISAGGGGELNIAYGLTPPADTSKLWVRIEDEPNEVVVKEATSFGKEVVSAYGISTPSSNKPQSLAYCNGHFYIKTNDTIYRYEDTGWVVAVSSAAEELRHYTAPAVVIGNKIFYLFGHTYTTYSTTAASPSYSSKYILVFDTETNTYTHVAVSGMPNECQLGNAVVIGTKIYFTAGQSGSSGTSAYIGSSHIYEIDSNDPSTATDIGYFYTTSADMRGASVVAVGSVLYAKQVHFGSDGSIPYRGYIEYFDTETKINSRTEVLINKSSVTSCFMPGINVGECIYWFGGIGRQNTPNELSNDGTSKDYAQRFNTVTGDFDFVTVGTHVGNSHNCALLSSTELVFARVGANMPTYKFTGAYELENGKLLIQESLFDNIWQAVKAKNGALSIGVNGVYLGGTDGYAQAKDAYLYDTTQQKWVSLDGTPLGGGVTPEPTPTPTLEGTWVLNEQLYPVNNFNEKIGCDVFINNTVTKHGITTIVSTETDLKFYKGGGIEYSLIYASQTWNLNAKVTSIQFYEGATASNEFMAWLTANATKQ